MPVVRPGAVGAVEGLEDLVALGGGDADALVRDGDLHLVADLRPLIRRCGTAPGATYLTALPTRLSSSWRTSAASRVDVGQRRRPRSAASATPVTAVRWSATGARHRLEVDDGGAQLLLARGRGLEQVADQPLHPAGRVADAVELRRGLVAGERLCVRRGRARASRSSPRPRASGPRRSCATTLANDSSAVRWARSVGDVVVDDDRLGEAAGVTGRQPPGADREGAAGRPVVEDQDDVLGRRRSPPRWPGPRDSSAAAGPVRRCS